MATDLFKNTKAPDTNIDGAPIQTVEIDDNTDDVTNITEIDFLKDRARIMGITYSNNIGVEALKQKINAKLAESSTSQADEEEEIQEEPKTSPVAAAPIPPRKMTLREKCIQDAMKLVRVRIQNLDPKKRELPGEIFTVANEYVGTVRKYVPYGEVTNNGYHIPQILFDNLKERRFVNIRIRKAPNGEPIIETNDALEFALEVLTPLTPEELARLASAQAAGNKIDE